MEGEGEGEGVNDARYGEAFIGQEKCSVMTVSGLGFREAYSITWC